VAVDAELDSARPDGAHAGALLGVHPFFHEAGEGALPSLGAIALYAGLAYYNALTPHRREPLVIFTLGSTAQLSNGAMMLATPIGGAHYFVDVFAGVAVAVLAIVAARWIDARVMKWASQPVAAATMPAGAVSTQ
jgi:hypothetical protein